MNRNLCNAIYCALGTAALYGLSSSVPSAAQDFPHLTVHYQDLNMDTPAGAKTLYGRIRVAARNVCDISIGGGSDPILRLALPPCVNHAIDDAVRKVNSPSLTSLRFGASEVRLASK